MKKILLVTDIFPPQIGGPATFIDRMARVLAAKGYRVTVVCSSDQAGEPSDRERPFKVRRVALTPALAYKVKMRLALFLEMLRHQQIFVNGLETYVRQISRILGRSYILKVVGDPVWETARNQGATLLNIDDFQHSVPEQNQWRHLVNRRNLYLQTARLIVTPSNYLKTMVINWGIPAGKVVTVSNGIGDEYLGASTPAPREGSPFSALFVGRLTNWKGVETILLASRELPDMQVQILGDGPEYPLLADLARQLGLEARVRFQGRVSPVAVRDEMARTHVLVLDSLYEGLSHTLLEAMARGVPCIAANCGGNPELVASGVNGLVIPPQDVASLVKALQMLRDDEPLRYRLAAAAQQSSRRFPLSVSIDNIVNLLDKTS